MYQRKRLFTMAISFIVALSLASDSHAANPVPVSSAGSNQAVNSGDTVMLDGLGSTYSTPGPINYEWTQTAGPAVVLIPNNTDPTPTFVAPAPGTLTFELRINDIFGTSEPDTVDIVVLAAGTPLPTTQFLVVEKYNLKFAGEGDFSNDKLKVKAMFNAPPGTIDFFQPITIQVGGMVRPYGDAERKKVVGNKAMYVFKDKENKQSEKLVIETDIKGTSKGKLTLSIKDRVRVGRGQPVTTFRNTNFKGSCAYMVLNKENGDKYKIAGGPDQTLFRPQIYIKKAKLAADKFTIQGVIDIASSDLPALRTPFTLTIGAYVAVVPTTGIPGVKFKAPKLTFKGNVGGVTKYSIDTATGKFKVSGTGPLVGLANPIIIGFAINGLDASVRLNMAQKNGAFSY